jgi:hypothetical protein
MGQLLLSLALMFIVVGTLVGWAFRTERRRQAEDS